MKAGDLLLSTWPIVRREFVGLLRTRKAFWISVLTVAAASLFPLAAWPKPGSPMPYFSALMAFSTYSGVITFALFLFVPAVTAGVISGERERETYELLYNTLIVPPGIVIGKLIAASGFFLLLLLLTSPMVSILYLLGGFQIRDLLWSFLMSALSILFMSLAGLWSSMRNQRTYHALVGAFAMLIIWVVLHSLLSFILQVRLWSPHPLIASLLGPGLAAGFALYFFLSLLRRARVPDLPSSRRQELKVLKTARLRGSVAPPRRTMLTALVLDHAREGIPDTWNAVLVTSIRSEVFGNARSRRKIFWGFAAIIMVVMAVYLALLVANRGGLNLVIPLAVNTHLLLYSLALIVPGSVAASLASERELGKLDFLRGTFLTSRKILWGKLWAGLFGGSGLLILGAILCGAVLFISLANPSAGSSSVGESIGTRAELSLAFLASAAAVMLASAVCGLLAATLSRTTAAAAVMSYVLTAGVLLIIPVFCGIAFQSAEVNEVTCCLSPLISFSYVTERAMMDREHLAVYAASLGVSLVSSTLMFLIAVEVFDRRWMRDP